MPTLMELALGTDMVPPVCPEVSTDVQLCTEGRSLASIMSDTQSERAAEVSANSEAAFMQYAACMHDDGIWHDGCDAAAEPHVMGYAIRTLDACGCKLHF